MIVSGADNEYIGSVELDFDPEFMMEVYKRHFRYEERRRWKLGPYYFMAGAFVVLIILGVLFDTPAATIWGFLLLVILFTILFPLFSYRLRVRRYLRQLWKQRKDETTRFTVAFNEDLICYTTDTYETKIKWLDFESVEENGSETYLFREGREIFDIIVQDRIGPDLYQKFKEVAFRKINSDVNVAESGKKENE